MAEFLDQLVWNALEASVLALGVALLLKTVRCRAGVRHVLWLLVVLKLMMPPVGGHPVGWSGSLRESLEWAKTHLNAGESTPPLLDAGSDASPAARTAARENAPLLRPAPEGRETPGARSEPDHATRGLRPATFPLPDELEREPRLRDFGTADDVVVSAEWTEEEPWWGAGVSPPPGEGVEDGSAVTGAPLEATTSFSLLSVVFGVWLGGALLAVLRGAVSLVTFRRRLGPLGDPSPAVSALCAELSTSLGLRRPPRLVVVQGDVTPMLWCLGRPRVIVSEELCASGHRDVLRGVLAHELAHLKRRDHWLSWLEIVAGVLYWWLPTVWYARRELRDAADESADAWAVSLLGSRERYAEALLTTLEILNRFCAPVPPVAHAIRRGADGKTTLKRRLTMILRDPIDRRLSWLTRGGLVLFALFVLPVAPERATGQSNPPGADGAEAPPDLIPAEVSGIDGVAPPAAEEPDVARRLDALERTLGQVLSELAEIRRATAGKASASPYGPVRAPTPGGIVAKPKNSSDEPPVADLERVLALQAKRIASLEQENARLQTELEAVRAGREFAKAKNLLEANVLEQLAVGPSAPSQPVTAAQLMELVTQAKTAFAAGRETAIRNLKMNSDNGTASLELRADNWDSLREGFQKLSASDVRTVLTELDLTHTPEEAVLSIDLSLPAERPFSTPPVVETLNRLLAALPEAKSDRWHSIRVVTRRAVAGVLPVDFNVEIYGKSEAAVLEEFSSLAQAAGAGFVTRVSIGKADKDKADGFVRLKGTLSTRRRERTSVPLIEDLFIRPTDKRK